MNNVTVKKDDNLFTLLDHELARMHKMFDKMYGGSSGENTKAVWDRLKTLQDLVEEVVKKGMTEDVKRDIKDLQNSVAEMMLTGGKDDPK